MANPNIDINQNQGQKKNIQNPGQNPNTKQPQQGQPGFDKSGQKVPEKEDLFRNQKDQGGMDRPQKH